MQFEVDCLARKHRGIASKLGATARTNKTGINPTRSKARLCWSSWSDLTIKFHLVCSGSGKVIIEKFCSSLNDIIIRKILPCRKKIIEFRREIFTSGLLFEEVHHILFSSLLLPEERPDLADLLTSSQFQYHLKLGNIFNTTPERKYFLQLIIYLMKIRSMFDTI